MNMPNQEVELRFADLQATIQQHYQRGDYTQALRVSQDLGQQCTAHFGQDHPATASAYNNIGLMHKLLGDFVPARQYYTSAMRIYAKIVGRDHASYAATLHNLGNLNKSQIHFDTSLKATERLALVETALEYLEEAWSIRNVELGPAHPHTVATKMAIGSTLATQVLYEYRMVERHHTVGNHQNHAKKQYVALNAQSITQQQWQAAEDHLREALQTAIDNPRGRRISGGNNDNKSGEDDTNSRSKKAHKKKNKTTHKRPAVTSSSSNSKNKDDNNNKFFHQRIETISAALAGQNLAVFLKSYAMTLEVDDPNVVPQQQQRTQQSQPKTLLLQEAKQLYERVLYIRNQLLAKDHPDVYATKYSLAEVLEVMGDEEAANVLRQEILDTYTPPDEEGNVESAPNTTVVIEKTKATT
jgi:tetratricopeptide (TPR) repeat protein